MFGVSRYLAILAVFLTVAGTSTTATAKSVAIKNIRTDKVKICAYRSDDGSLVRSRKCWMLKGGQAVKWKRGEDRYRFDVRVFGPGVFELPLCMKRNIAETFYIRVTPPETGNCVTAFSRTTVPVQKWGYGAAVLVNRHGDNFWYPAEVLKPSATGYRLRFRDGRVAEARSRYISDDILRVGSSIEANWKNQGRWYSGRITKRDQSFVTIAYDDGGTEKTTLGSVRLLIGNP